MKEYRRLLIASPRLSALVVLHVDSTHCVVDSTDTLCGTVWEMCAGCSIAHSILYHAVGMQFAI